MTGNKESTKLGLILYVEDPGAIRLATTMDYTNSMPTDESLTDPVVFSDKFKEYIAKHDVQKVYDTMEQCKNIFEVCNKAIEFLSKPVVQKAIKKHCPAFLNVIKATGLAGVFGPASIAVGIGMDVLLVTGMVEDIDPVMCKLDEISSMVEQLREDVERGFKSLNVQFKVMQALESFLPVFNNLHMNVLNYEGLLARCRPGSMNTDQGTFIKRLGLMVRDYSPNMIIRDLRQMHALIVGKGGFGLGKPLFDRLEEELNGLEGEDADQFIATLLLQFQTVVGLQVRAIHMLRTFVTYCREDETFCDDMVSIHENLALQRQQYDPAIKYSKYIKFMTVGGEFTLLPQKYPDTKAYVEKPLFTAMFGARAESRFGKGHYANKGVLIATPHPQHEGTFLISSKMWPNYYLYILQTPIREMVAREFEAPGDPGPKGHWMFSAIDLRAGVFTLSTRKWPKSYLCTMDIPVPPTCRIVYQCKGHAISVFLKVHQWSSRSIYNYAMHKYV